MQLILYMYTHTYIKYIEIFLIICGINIVFCAT